MVLWYPQKDIFVVSYLYFIMPEFSGIFLSAKCSITLFPENISKLKVFRYFQEVQNLGLIWVNKISDNSLHHLTIKNFLKPITYRFQFLRFSFQFLNLLKCICYQKEHILKTYMWLVLILGTRPVTLWKVFHNYSSSPAQKTGQRMPHQR